MLPDRGQYIPHPDYIRQLIRRIGWTQREVAEHIGMPLRTLEYKLAGNQRFRYCEQVAIEKLEFEITATITVKTCKYRTNI